MPDVNQESDFLEFFGKPMDEVLRPRQGLNGEGKLKRRLYPTHNISQKELFKIVKDSEYFTAMSAGVQTNWFSNLSNLGYDAHDLILKVPAEILINYNKKISDIKVLDFGCGTGSNGLWLSQHGFDVTLADIPHQHFKFLKFLCNKYNVKARFHELPCVNYHKFKMKYDYIICNEVLEHVDEPEEVLASLIDSMSINGVMYLSTFFDDMNGADPSHLKKNTVRYNDFSKWMKIVDALGLICSIKNHDGTPKVFVKR